MLGATDDYFTAGQIGFDTFGNTRATFSGLRALEAPPVSQLVRVLETVPYVLKRDYAHRR